MSESKKRNGLVQILCTDVKSALIASVTGLTLMALVDGITTIVVAPPPIGFTTILRLIPLEFTIAILLMPAATALCVGAALITRLSIRAPEWPGLFGAFQRQNAASKAAAWMWGLAIAGLSFLVASTVATIKLSKIFKEPKLTALTLSLLQLLCFGILAGVAVLTAAQVHKLGQRLHSRLGVLNPFGFFPAASVVLVLLLWPMFHILLAHIPQLSPLIPWRHLLSLGTFLLGCYASTHWHALSRPSLSWTPKQLRTTLTGAGLLSLLVVPLTLFRIGADPNTKALAVSSSPPIASVMNGLRRVTDFDNDGFGFLLGENDCAPFDTQIHPLARDIPDNGIDENCDGRDFSVGVLPSYKKSEDTIPVPAAYQDDWNVLLLTIDTVRFDHTSFGGYTRDTTPRLAEFAARSATFMFANAPSAGTMASIPAILTSKFFHSGIALDHTTPRGMPPKLLESNTLLPELFKDKGYHTGAILSHEYFNDWGMEQGIDSYDNSIGAVRAPYAVTSDKITDRSIAWIGKQKDRKWFLWVHYIDPHGRYVSHPGEVSYGNTEKDLYDGELHFTDKHMGVLLDYVARSKFGKKTIIIVTSDHGDAFGEHGYINHAQDLHRELLHVPLIFYVPNIQPREIPGTVSPIDIFPTLAAIMSMDTSHLNIEGQSLVPQLFYGKDARHRIVFAETNYPKPLRAVVNTRYKLILDLKNNVSRLYNLEKDPLETTNVWTRDPDGYQEMRGYLDEWIERVVYSRDTSSNQAIAKLADHLVPQRPDAAVELPVLTTINNGTIAIDSYEVEPQVDRAPGELKIAVYFRVNEATPTDIRFQLEAWTDALPPPQRPIRSASRSTGNGMFPSSRWRPGEMVRDRFTIKIPKNWKDLPAGSSINLGIRMQPARHTPTPLTLLGRRKQGTSDVLMLGSVKLALPPPPTELPNATRPKDTNHR